MNAFLRFALAFCPREFRDKFEGDVAYDASHADQPLFAQAADVFAAGIAMHLESFWRDLTFAVRTLAKSRARLFTIIAILTIALAMGANVAVVSVLKAVILQPLPYRDASRLVFVTEGTGWVFDLSHPDVLAIEHGNTVFERFAESISRTLTLTRTSDVLSVHVAAVSGSYFAALGVRPEIGRLLTPADNAARRVVIADDFWRTHFRASPAAIGKHLNLDGTDYEIIGVAPPYFQSPTSAGPRPYSIWMPIDSHAGYASSGSSNSYGIGVLRPGVSVAQAQSDMNRILWRRARLDPDDHVGFHGAQVVPMLSLMVAPIAPLLWLLYAAALLVLIIACVNIANLSLVRAVARSRELVLRSALGASRYRLAAALCTETFILSLAGTVIGIGLGILALKGFSQIGAATLPRWDTVRIDWVVLAYAGAIVVAFTFFSGLLPLFAHRGALAPGVRAGGRTDTKARVGRAHAALIIAEIALAIAVVCSAGLILRSFIALTHVDIGFDPRNVYLSTYDLPNSQCAKLQPCADLMQRIQTSVAGIPGVKYVSASIAAPFGRDSNETYVTPAHEPAAKVTVMADVISPDFFRTLGTPLLRGRAFTPNDRAGSMPVAIINAALARRLYGSLDALGKHVVAAGSFSGPYPTLTIVGVAADMRISYSKPAGPTVYVPFAQLPSGGELVIRTAAGLPQASAAVSAAFGRVAPMLPRPATVPYTDLLERNAMQAQASTMLFGALALIALALAMCGVFAVSLYSVEQRTREFGIRSALGAGARSLLADVLRRAGVHSILGVVLGLAVAALATRFLQSQLFETSPLDPVTFAGVTLVIVACAFAASLIPAVRAAGLDPVAALRYE
jgi:putative ABC transport system permease protein